MPSALSSGMVMPNSFSNSMMSSTVSRLSAPRSLVNSAVSVTSFSSTPSLSTMIALTRDAISDIVVKRVLIENPAFIANYTGYKNLELLACIQNRIGKEEIQKTMEDVGLEPDDKRKYRKYSLGMKQKLGIASAFMEKPDIIILDEPINAIDETGVLKVKKMIQEAKSRGAVIITACHDAEELQELSDEIIQIAEGRIVKNGKTDL